MPAKGGKKRGLRADLAFMSGDGAQATHLIDVTVRVAEAKKGEGALKGETAKEKYYNKHYDLSGTSLVPFALERNGTWGRQAVELMKAMGNHVAPHDKLAAERVTQLYMGTIAVYLQRTNAWFVMRFLRACHRQWGIPLAAAATM